jgi:tetratricopeptide (TPR) repeat protein
MTLRTSAFVVGCALLVTAAAARAKEPVPPRVQELVKQMMVDYNTGDFQAALDKATEAYRLKSLPALLFNIGQFHKELHHWERAEFFFHRYLNERPDAPNRELVEKLLAEVQQKEAETAAPAAAPTPAPVIVETAPPPPKATTPAPAAATSESEASLSAEPKSRSHVLGYSLIGGAVLLGIGAGLASIPVYDMNQTNQQVNHPASGATALAYSKVQSADSQGSTFQGVAIGVGIAAALCAGAAVWLW